MARKTKLTANLRSSIKSAIIADVPVIDYQSIIQDYLNQKAREQLPVELQDSRFACYLSNAYVREFGKYVPNPCYAPTDVDRDFVRIHKNLDFEQDEKLRELRRGVTAVLGSFNYVEDLIAATPDFAAYSPTKEEEVRVDLPAVQLVERLHVLGWPKSDEGK